ncbi:MAG: hypothetical protein GXY86_03955 [Firmicutes bacterium]|nr:hypothetical protein [Bacillota bacterium]
MYIIGLNSQQHFYFISTEDQRSKLEAKGILVLKNTYERLTAAAAAVRELNNEKRKLLSSRPRQFSIDSQKAI